MKTAKTSSAKPEAAATTAKPEAAATTVALEVKQTATDAAALSAIPIYSMIDKETLHSMLETFSMCFHLPIQLIDEHGHTVDQCGQTCAFCTHIQGFFPPKDSCEQIHVKAAKKAIDLGEAYIFSCPADLNHIVFPLMSRQVFLGSILAGPFLMSPPDSVFMLNLSKKYDISIPDLLELNDESVFLPILDPSMVHHISRMLFYLFSHVIEDGKETLKRNQGKLYQQSKINEAIQHYKFTENNNPIYPYEKEQELMIKVKTGNIRDAKAILNELLGYLFFSEGNSLDTLKARATELCSLLSRAAMEGGAPSDAILKQNNSFFRNLQDIVDIETLCEKLMEVVEAFTESMFHCAQGKNSEIVRKSIQYISIHFREPITLDEVAKHVHLHPSYFSTIFKQVTGFSFREHLNMVRVEEGKRLLLNTDYSIIDIAVAIGFEDQSYFSKVFKRYTGNSPKQYR